jgi:hypothetical protein
MVLSNSFQTSLYPTIYIVWIKCLPEVEYLPIVAVIVPDSCPASETLFPSPIGCSAPNHGVMIRTQGAKSQFGNPSIPTHS